MDRARITKTGRNAILREETKKEMGSSLKGGVGGTDSELPGGPSTIFKSRENETHTSIDWASRTPCSWSWHVFPRARYGLIDI